MTILALALPMLLANCANPAISTEDVTAPETWGGVDNVVRVRHLYFSGQPDDETLRVAQEKGVTTIINLRDPSESAWDEKSAVEALGLHYVNVPVRHGSNTLDSAAMSAIEAAVKAQHGEPVLLHCSSGNRAAAWLAVHLVTTHDMPLDDALSVAKKAGLTSAGMAGRAETYIEESSEP